MRDSNQRLAELGTNPAVTIDCILDRAKSLHFIDRHVPLCGLRLASAIFRCFGVVAKDKAESSTPGIGSQPFPRCQKHFRS